MPTAYLLFFVSFVVFSQTKPRIEVIPAPKSIEDFDHQYKGCPENSECDQTMGLQLSRWKELVKKLQKETAAQKQAQFLELFREKYGIPTEFYTTQKSDQGFRPVLFDSHCREHRPKDQERILKGTAFIKSLSKDKAIVFRDQSVLEVPVGELLTPQKVDVLYGTEVISYYLPLGDQPLFIKDKKLHILKEDEGLFFLLVIGPQGDWKVRAMDFTKLSQFEENRSEVPCPKELIISPNKAFNTAFCKTVRDADQNKNVIVQLKLGCPI